MGLLRRCFPYYLRYRFPSALGKRRFPNGLVLRYSCPSCEKHFRDHAPGLDAKSFEKVPLIRRCEYCGVRLTLENVFEERRIRS